MAYSINPNLPRARATALKQLLVEGVPLSIVAQRAGVHPEYYLALETKMAAAQPVPPVRQPKSPNPSRRKEQAVNLSLVNHH